MPFGAGFNDALTPTRFSSIVFPKIVDTRVVSLRSFFKFDKLKIFWRGSLKILLKRFHGNVHSNWTTKPVSYVTSISAFEHIFLFISRKLETKRAKKVSSSFQNLKNIEISHYENPFLNKTFFLSVFHISALKQIREPTMLK